MGGVLIRKAFQKTLLQVRHITVVPPAQAHDLVATVYTDAEHDYGVLSPALAVHSPIPDLLAAAWILTRETLIADGRVDRATKEAVATSVSIANACQFGVDLHLTTLDAVNERRDATGSDDAAAVAADHSVRVLSEWARSSAGAGWRTTPFAADQAPELLGTVLAAHYLNRIATLFLPRSAVPAGITAAAGPAALRLLGGHLLTAAARPHRPGASLRLLPDAALPADLAWAQGNPGIAAALARVAAATDAAGARAVPAPVRDLVTRELSQWDGDPTGIGPDWADARMSALDDADRPAGRLALLVALAPHAVDLAVVEEFRRGRRADRDLVELTAWASMAAARRICARIAPAPVARVLPFRRRRNRNDVADAPG
ncbi:carboxymuconolactone decarboxylase family protein [Actinophytocola sp.]|uniref:carboxymuconolactone decarboxylase family protein n=1 Tax=Actinophytocola sp. TaxID=1872138 RepID=UPI002D801746|nr:carboxymuconolactone decarboxylase family protein [Actinophytocola sp.]HET9139107.1 carboxymuconolactone decarboxylase family protein [Actinophytocola sp.]